MLPFCWMMDMSTPSNRLSSAINLSIQLKNLNNLKLFVIQYLCNPSRKFYNMQCQTIIIINIRESMINKDLLADLDDLDDDDEMEQENIEEQPMDDQKNDNGVKLQQYGITTIAAQKHSRLLTANRDKFLEHMKIVNDKIDAKIEQGQKIKNESDVQNKQELMALINKCNYYASEINKEIAAIVKYIRQIYSKKIPELESSVTNNAHYCRAVLQIEQGPENQAKGKFQYLGQHLRLSLTVSTSTPRDPLSKQDQKSVIDACKIVIQLKNHYETLMIFLETCMQFVAPNLCQLVGSAMASKLIAAAGGVDKLAAMPACNIQVMGGSRSAQIGFSQMERNHTGIFGQMDVVKDAPQKFQMKLVRMLATNTAKCARVDYLGTSTTQGAKLRDEMYERFEKIQEEGGLMRIDKPLEIPDLQPKKKRGGKKHRRTKELYQMTELRKNQNRLKFGEEAQQQIEQGVGLGMLKQASGKLHVKIKKQKLKMSKKMQQRANKKSGLESSLNLNAHQGIELINPSLKDEKAKTSGTESYFAKQAGFRTIINNKLNK